MYMIKRIVLNAIKYTLFVLLFGIHAIVQKTML